MLERQKRLMEVWEHVHTYYGIHTKGEWADFLHYARPYISSALNGNRKYLTDKLFANICEAYPGMFNIDYLLTGNGTLLTTEEEDSIDRLTAPTPAPQQTAPGTPDLSSMVNALIAANADTIASLKRELVAKEETIEALHREVAANEQTAAVLRSQLDDKDAIIKAKDDLIATLRQQLVQARVSLSDYPFPIGVADRTNIELKPQNNHK